MIETTCKFCRRPIEMDVDPTGLSSGILDLSKWLKNVACNRCAEYRKRNYKIKDRIKSACVLIMHNRHGANDIGVDDKLRERITHHTRALAESICDHHYVELVWQSEWVDQIMDHPAKWMPICTAYAQGIAALSQTHGQHQGRTESIKTRHMSNATLKLGIVVSGCGGKNQRNLFLEELKLVGMRGPEGGHETNF